MWSRRVNAHHPFRVVLSFGRCPWRRRITRGGRGGVTPPAHTLYSVGEPEETGDASRRTHLANERTYLAWWRTGVTALAASVAVGGLIPSLTHRVRWPYTVVGVGFALLGVFVLGYGFERQRAVRQALISGGFKHPSDLFLFVLSGSGCVLGCLLLVIVLFNL